MKYATDKYGLVIHLASRYYKFLMKYHKEEVLSLAKTADFLLCGRVELQEASRFLQRHLYRIAKENGWFKNKKNHLRWEKREREEQWI